MKEESKLFAAILKYWRGKRGLSQLDLALAADVSSRHVSFLETGRARPSEEMVLLLAATLELPLRERNTMLREAGFTGHFEEQGLEALQDPGIERALQRMMSQHEPFPMMLMNKWYDILRMNKGAQRLLEIMLGDVAASGEPINAIRAFFDPSSIKPFVRNWDELARELISRLHRESLHTPHDKRLTVLLDDVLASPGIPKEWRKPDLSIGSHAAFTFQFDVNGVSISFVTTLMSFSAPQNVALDELQIESYFPLDDETENVCMMLADTTK